MQRLRFKKLPIAATPIRIKDLFYNRKVTQGDFQRALEEYLKVRYCFLVNSGIAASYLILKGLRRFSGRKEVILPAYTAPALALPIRKLGLEARLCDIDLETFNLDIYSLKRLISKNTLCILAVHLFGIPCGIQQITEIAKQEDIFVIEDAAQAQGSTINCTMVGTFGDMGFLSFNRGKNLPTYSGGCIVTNSQQLAGIIKEEISCLKKLHSFSGFIAFLKIAGLCFATRPIFYGLFYPFIRPFKSNKVSGDFGLSEYTDFQAKLGLVLLKRSKEFSERRYRNGIFLINALKTAKKIILPKVSGGTQPAFNRLPVVFEDLNTIKEAQKRLWRKGMETSRLYLRPLHHIFDLGYKKEDFPNANYFAQHLLTLPAHPLLREEDLLKIVETILKI